MCLSLHLLVSLFYLTHHNDLDQRPRIIASSTVRFSFGRLDGGVGALRFCGWLTFFSSWSFLCLESDLCFITFHSFGFMDTSCRPHAMRCNPLETIRLRVHGHLRKELRRLRIVPLRCRIPRPFRGVLSRDSAAKDLRIIAADVRTHVVAPHILRGTRAFWRLVRLGDRSGSGFLFGVLAFWFHDV